jgi:hypothetical protein
MGRDRPTRALGRRDWRYFDRVHTRGGLENELSPRQPWQSTATHRDERHDRTLGIPPREINMWPGRGRPTEAPRGLGDHRDFDDLLDEGLLPTRRVELLPIDLDTAIGALADIAAGLPRLPRPELGRRLREIAGDRAVDSADLGELVIAVGTMVARVLPHDAAWTTHGRTPHYALLDADVPHAVEIYYARQHLTRLTRASDPDLPRLTMLLNGLTHRVPLQVMRTVPATVHGPLTALQATRRDLIGWRGMRAAIHELTTITTAAQAGRAWLKNAASTRDNVHLAIGLVHLTHPTVAAELATAGPHRLSIGDIRRACRRIPPPNTVTDLSDQALAAACARRGWLTGEPDERLERRVIEHAVSERIDGATIRRLADGDTGIVRRELLAGAPTDADLADLANIPADYGPVMSRRAYLTVTSGQAIAQFGDQVVMPHPTRADAIGARFPERPLRSFLTARYALRPAAITGPSTGPDPDLGAEAPDPSAEPGPAEPPPTFGLDL